MQREVITWYLEMLQPEALRPAPCPAPDVSVVRAEVPSPELNRFLYTAVGGDWYWTDRLTWDYARWLAYLDRPELETWVAYVSGTPAGYVELELQPEGNVEVAYFGLLARFTGRGIGGYLLSAGVQRAWQGGARRVWVHTCSLDGPHALANYLSRGFRVYREAREMQEVPDTAPGPWPGANRPRQAGPGSAGASGAGPGSAGPGGSGTLRDMDRGDAPRGGVKIDATQPARA